MPTYIAETEQEIDRIYRECLSIHKIKKITKKKTPEDRYKEMRKDLSRCLNIKNIKKIDGIMKPYLELRDEELLQKVLDDTKDIRVVHEMRSWIRDYIISRK